MCIIKNQIWITVLLKSLLTNTVDGSKISVSKYQFALSCSKDMDFTVAKPVKIYNITQNLVYH